MIRPRIRHFYMMAENKWLLVFCDGSRRLGTETEAIAEGADPNNIRRIKEDNKRSREANKKAFPQLFKNA